MTDAAPKLTLEPPTPQAPHPPSPWRSAWVITAAALVVALAGASAFVLLQRDKYRAETARLRASMTTIERERADQIVSQEHNKLRLALALFRRQARLERELHLAISVDSAAMYLQREGALLREMPVVIGAEKRIGSPPDTVRMAPPLGVRTIARVLVESDTWDIPAWVFGDRGLAVPAERALPGALGPAAIVLDGGTIIYSLPAAGPLADSAYVLPGGVRARAEDLRAVAPNLRPGMRIYFY